MLVLVALVAVALACVIWPRKRGVWESSAPGVANRFVIEFKRSPFHLVAVATPVGLGGQYADRIVFWFDGESIQHANLVENEEVVELPIRVYGDWPLKLYVVTYGERAVIESLTVDADGRVGNVHGIELLQPDDPRLAGNVQEWGYNDLFNRRGFFHSRDNNRLWRCGIHPLRTNG